MQKYMNACPGSMVSMMGDYHSILARYTGFAAQIARHETDRLGGVLIRVFCLAITAGMPLLPGTGSSECR